LISKFFENNILQSPFRETRAQQGFQRISKQKNRAESAVKGPNARIARCPSNFILMEKSTPIKEPETKA
jgi:hypothetical protein